MVKAATEKAMALADIGAAEDVPMDADGFGSLWVTDGMTPGQASECAATRARVKARPKRPYVLLKTNPEGGRAIHTGDPEKEGSDVLNSVRFYDVMCSGSEQFVHSCLTRIVPAARVTGDDRRDSETVGAAVALIASITPQNEMETTMAIQMVAANDAALLFFDRARSAQHLEHATAFSNIANKAMRSFALHAEALAKIRRNGEQVVRHVHVSDGGQAVIAGTINSGGAGVV